MRPDGRRRGGRVYRTNLVPDAAAEHEQRYRCEAAAALRVARRAVPPMKRFTYLLRLELGWPSLSRQAVYGWESCQTRMPVEVLIAAAKVTGRTVDHLLQQSCDH
jgi:hypothetical protein